MPTLSLILTGTVLASGVLLLLSGATKLSRTSNDSAIRAALRVSPHRWRQIETVAGVIETVTGTAVCLAIFMGFHPAIAGTALAALGAIFSGLLAYTRRAKVSGGCSCVRPSKNADAAITWPVQARAAWLLTAGVIQALIHLPRPTPTIGDGIVVSVVALSTLTLMLAAEGPWHITTCRLRIPLGPRTTLKALMTHGVFESMVNSVGPFTEGFAYRRDGCVEEFVFTSTPRSGRADRAVAFRVSRTPHGANGLAVEARIETRSPSERAAETVQRVAV